MSDYVETITISDPEGASDRIVAMKLNLDGLEAVVETALAERNNATDLFCANSAGTFAYHHGVAALRRIFGGVDWATDRRDGIEGIFCAELGIKVGFCNVDKACGRDHPKPRSKKGAGAERASSPMLFPDLQEYAPRQTEGSALFYVMVDQLGRAELTRPVVARETFVAVIERIFLITEVTDGDPLLDVDIDDATEDFEPEITQKKTDRV